MVAISRERRTVVGAYLEAAGDTLHRHTPPWIISRTVPSIDLEVTEREKGRMRMSDRESDEISWMTRKASLYLSCFYKLDSDRVQTLIFLKSFKESDGSGYGNVTTRKGLSLIFQNPNKNPNPIRKEQIHWHWACGYSLQLKSRLKMNLR